MNWVRDLGRRLYLRRHYYTVFLAAIAAWYGYWVYYHPLARERSARERAENIKREFDIQVDFGPPRKFAVGTVISANQIIFPGTACAQASPGHAAAALAGVEDALRQYTTGFARNCVMGIFVCEALQVFGMRAGGMYGPVWVVLTAPPRPDYDVRQFARYAFHHELSSIVLDKNPDWSKQWSAFAPKDWDFARSVYEALPDNRLEQTLRNWFDTPQPETGFLSAYGGTSPENDFNEYAAKVFTEPQAVRELASQYPLISRKLDFVLQRYVALDPQMQETFEGLGFRMGESGQLSESPNSH